MARGRVWSEHEDALLRRFWRRGVSDREIVAHIPSRTAAAIQSRATVLGLPHRPNQNKGGQPPGAIWTDERRAFVTKHYQDGRSASQIVAMLDVPTTRNAVIGIISRMGLSRMRTISESAADASVRMIIRSRHQPTPRAPRAAEAFQECKAQEVPATGELVPLNDLEMGQCRWPFGDPQRQPFGFCGAPKVPGLSYCRPHAVIAHVDGDLALVRAEQRERVKAQRVKEEV